MMKKADAEREIRALIWYWRGLEPQQRLSVQELHSSDFIDWLRINSPGHLDFRSTLSVPDTIDLWFNNELKQSWRY